MPGVLPEVIVLAAVAPEEVIALHPQVLVRGRQAQALDQGHLVHLLVHPVQEEEEGNIILFYL